MKKKFNYIYFIPILFLYNLCYSQPDIQKIRQLIINTAKVNVSNPSADPNGDIITPRHNVGYSGSGANRREEFEEKRSLTKTLEKFVAFNPNADAVFPGSLIQGESLPDGVLNPIKTLRTPLIITITDLVGSNPFGSYSTNIEEVLPSPFQSFSKKIIDPTLANVNEGIRQILNQNLQKEQPAKISYSQTMISTVEEGFLKLGASFKWTTGSVDGSFQRNTAQYKTSFMVRFVQSYYTVSCEPPSNPASFISTNTKFADFKNYVWDRNPPTYISSVTYGRELWMLIESNYEVDSVRATLNVAFSGGFGSGSIDLNAGHKKLLNESSIQILILGGPSKPAIEVITGDGVTKMKDYLLKGANYSKKSPGVIISYTVRYLKDNDIARVSSYTDYTIKTSVAAPEPVFLTTIRIIWRTAGDGKDWNTQPVVNVYDKSGRHIGHIDCCSADRNADKWDDGERTRDLQILIGGISFEDLSQGRFDATCNPYGNDNWDYEATIEFTFTNKQVITKKCNGRNSCSTSW